MEEKRLIKFEMRRAFGKTFFIAYLIGFLSGCGGLISYWIQVRWTPVESISCFDAWLYCYSVAESSAYKVIFPLVIKSIMEQIQLDPDDHRRVKEYSLGMKQKLAVVQAVMEKPELLILDEPTRGLDESGINCVHSILREQHKNGVTILIASHDKADIKSLCQHVFYLEEGRLVKTD